MPYSADLLAEINASALKNYLNKRDVLSQDIPQTQPEGLTRQGHVPRQVAQLLGQVLAHVLSQIFVVDHMPLDRGSHLSGLGQQAEGDVGKVFPHSGVSLCGSDRQLLVGVCIHGLFTFDRMYLAKTLTPPRILVPLERLHVPVEG